MLAGTVWIVATTLWLHSCLQDASLEQLVRNLSSDNPEKRVRAEESLVRVLIEETDKEEKLRRIAQAIRDPEVEDRIGRILRRVERHRISELQLRPLAVLGSHPTGGEQVRFSRDGNWLVASGGCNGMVRVWKTKDWSMYAEFIRPEVTTVDVALGNDVALAVHIPIGGQGDFSASLYSISGKRCLWKKGGFSGLIAAAASQSGKELAVCADLKYVILDAENGRIRKVLPAAVDSWGPMAFTPDGSVFVAGFRQEIRAYSTSDYSLKKKILIDEGHVRRIAVDGQHRVVVSLDDRGVLYWHDLASGKLQGRLKTPVEMLSLAVDESGRWIVTTSRHGHIFVWDARNKVLHASWKAHEDEIWGADVSLKLGLVATCGSDGKVRLWKIPKEPTMRKIKQQGSVEAASADGTLVVIHKGTDLYVARRKGRVIQCRILFPGSHPLVRLSPDGTLLMLAPWRKGPLRIFDAETGELLHSIGSDNQCVVASRFSRNSKTIGVLQKSGRFTVVEARTGNLMTRKQIEMSGLTRFKLSPSFGFAIAKDLDGQWRLINLRTGASEALPAWVFSTAFSPDGRYLVRAGSEIEVVDLESKMVTHRFSPAKGAHPHRYRTFVNVWTTSRANIVVAQCLNKSLLIWRTDSGTAFEMVPPSRISEVFIWNDLLALSWGELYELQPPWGIRPERVLSIGSGPVRDIEFSDPKSLVVTAGSGSVQIWDLRTGGSVRLGALDQESFDCVAVSPDGELLALGGPEGTVEVWRIDPPERVKAFSAFKDSVNVVRFSRDGKYLLAGGESGLVRMWGVNGWSRIGAWKAISGRVSDARISLDGRYVLVTSSGLADIGDYKLAVWDWRKQEQVDYLDDDCYMINLVLHPQEPVAYTIRGPYGGRLRQKPLRVSLGKRWTIEEEDLLEGYSAALAFSPEGKFSIASGKRGTMLLWGRDLSPLRELELNGRVSGLAISPCGRYLIAVVDYRITLWRIDRGR